MQFSHSEYSTIHNWHRLSSISGYLAMGNFDGVHLGHRELIKEAKKKGEVTVLTYTPHPAIALGSVNSPFLITSDLEKHNLLKEIGVDRIIFLDFDKELSEMLPEEFIKNIIKDRFNPQGVIIGRDHHFGKGREGTPEYLIRAGRISSFEVIVYPVVIIDNKPVKSSVIRGLIQKREIGVVNRLLSHPYQISGKVIEGDKLGEGLGYPTANIEVDSAYKLIPADGVYSAVAKIKESKFSAMLYIGKSPTYGGRERKIEVHLIDFSGDLYDERIECEVYSFIREDRKFCSEEMLKENMEKDKMEIIKSLKEVCK
ncbi:bifunctional riboflavin kinase/FAD synthetase [candidate division WOR-3 bacterium]|nr:bifunctional riboflavin kinase/FAD synthetase [candidate division WOR-3 bacterium]